MWQLTTASAQQEPLHLSLSAEQAALLFSLWRGDDMMAFDPSKRMTLQKLLATLGMGVGINSHDLLSSAAIEKTLDLDLVNHSMDSLRRLLAKGEALYVMDASQMLYNKCLQALSSSRDIHVAETQFHLGMLVGTAQEYVLPWYQRDQTVIQTYNHIEENILDKFAMNALLRQEYLRLRAKRGRHYRVLWQFEKCIKECEECLISLEEGDSCSLRTHFLCERAHIEATRGDEWLWMQKLEEARRGVLNMPQTDREMGLNQVNYMQGEGYKRFAFHTQKDFSISMREKYAKYALDQFPQWQGATIEVPGFEALVVQVSRAQCFILIDPDEAIHQAEQLRKQAELQYPTLLDKIYRVSFLAQQRLQMSSSEFAQIFNEAAVYHLGKNIL
jgi:hypothetical protein